MTPALSLEPIYGTCSLLLRPVEYLRSSTCTGLPVGNPAPDGESSTVEPIYGSALLRPLSPVQALQYKIHLHSFMYIYMCI